MWRAELVPWLLAWVGLFCSTGCATKRPPPNMAGETVVNIRFKGNTHSWQGQGDFNLRSAIEQKRNPSLTWLLRPRHRRVMLDRDTLEMDAWRIEAWYAHRGYFDTRFAGWDIIRVREPIRFLFWQQPARVLIIGYLDEREPSLVRDVHWEGLDTAGPTRTGLISRAPVQGRSLSEAERLARAQEDWSERRCEALAADSRPPSAEAGNRFELEDLRETIAMVHKELHEKGFAYAEVDAVVHACPEIRQVDVEISVELGPLCKLGEIRLTGDYTIPQHFIFEQLDQDLVAGDRYSTKVLTQAQRKLFGLGTFSVVNVVPVLDEEQTPEVPIEIQLEQSLPRQLRLGGGVELQTGQQDVHLSVEYENVNLFNRLLRLNSATSVGYTALTSELVSELTEGEVDIPDVFPTLDTSLSLTLPSFPVPHWSLGSELSFQLGVEEGYGFATPEISPVITGRLGRSFTLGLSYHLRFFDYLFEGDLPRYLDFLYSDDLFADEFDCSQFDSKTLGLDCEDPYLLSFLGQKLTIDTRGNVLSSREGQYGVYEISESGRFLGSQFNFIRVTADQRFYIPLRSLREWVPALLKSSVGLRVGGGIIEPYGSSEYAGVPYAERLRLGGSNSVRGWTLDHLGPYIYACEGEDIENEPSVYGQSPGCASIDAVEVTPVGGLVSLHGGGELRLYHPRWEEYGLVLFADNGMVWQSRQDVALSQLQYSAGMGLRYRTDLGPLRMDVARRVGGSEMFAQENRWSFHFSLSEAF